MLLACCTNIVHGQTTSRLEWCNGIRCSECIESNANEIAQASIDTDYYAGGL